MTIDGKIEEIITPVLNELDIDLVELSFRGTHGNRILRLFVDTENGITIEKCKNVSREISDILDAEDIITGKYRLEVSSPGLDRPMRTVRNFRRNIGREIRFTYQVEDTISTFQGVMDSVAEEKVTLKLKNELVTFSISQIENAKVVLKW